MQHLPMHWSKTSVNPSSQESHENAPEAVLYEQVAQPVGQAVKKNTQHKFCMICINKIENHFLCCNLAPIY